MRKFEVMVSIAVLALTLPGAAHAWGGNLFNSVLSSAVQQGVQQATSPQPAGTENGAALAGNIAGAAMQQAVVNGRVGIGHSAEVAGASLLIGAALASGAQADSAGVAESAPVAPASVESQAAGAAIGGLMRGLFGR